VCLLSLQIPDPHGPPALHHQTQPAELPALTHGHAAPEAAPGRLRHAHGGQVAPGLLQVSGGRWEASVLRYTNKTRLGRGADARKNTFQSIWLGKCLNVCSRSSE